MAVAAGRGSISDTIAYAKRWDAQTPEVSRFIKASAGTTLTASPGWGSELVSDTVLVSQFVDLVRDATVLNKLNGMRQVPPRSTIQVQTAGSTFAWVGETAVKPVGELAFETISIGDHKVAGIVVISEELVRRSEPSAEAAVRRDLVEQCARYIDAQFLTTSVSATSTNPASITNGVSSPAASGTDADAFYADLNTALSTFDSIGTDSVYIITTPALARGLATLRTTLGVFEFPNVTTNGGTIAGFPVIVSGVVQDGLVIVVKANEIFIADEGRVRIDASNQATLDMSGGSSPVFNLWQRNCIGLRAEQFITWAKRRDESVAIIDTASYGPSVGSPSRQRPQNEPVWPQHHTTAEGDRVAVSGQRVTQLVAVDQRTDDRRLAAER
jgi:HK97 family phage major capsid protein